MAWEVRTRAWHQRLRDWLRSRRAAHPEETETDFAGMGISFRFGYKDWFDFSFRIGPRKSSHKSIEKEILLQPGYHVRYHGARGKRIEIKDDIVSLVILFIPFMQPE